MHNNVKLTINIRENNVTFSGKQEEININDIIEGKNKYFEINIL
jgi:hypothetical protein